MNESQIKQEVAGHDVVFSFGEENTKNLDANFLGPTERYYDQPLQNAKTLFNLAYEAVNRSWVEVYVLNWIIPDVPDAYDVNLGVFNHKEDAMTFAKLFVPEYRRMMVKCFDGEQEKIDEQYKEKFYFSIYKCGYYKKL